MSTLSWILVCGVTMVFGFLFGYLLGEGSKAHRTDNEKSEKAYELARVVSARLSKKYHVFYPDKTWVRLDETEIYEEVLPPIEEELGRTP